MNTHLKKVLKFSERFGQHVGKHPGEVEPLAIRQLRIKLLFEEILELAEATDVIATYKDLCDGVVSSEQWLGATDGDAVGKIDQHDAFCDIQYVLDGAIIAAGQHEVFDENFERVHYNNMDKAHRSIEHLKETVAHKGMGDNFQVIHKDDSYLLYNADGKLIKPWDHEKVRLNLE